MKCLTMNATEGTTYSQIHNVGKDDNDEFWNGIEIITGFVVPMYIRNVLKFHGFDSALTVRLMDEEDIKEMEKFARSGVMQRISAGEVNLQDFYGPFVKSTKDFQFLRGHRKVLKDIAQFIREKGSHNITDSLNEIKNNTTRRDEAGSNASQSNKSYRNVTAEADNSARDYVKNKNDLNHEPSTTSSLTPTAPIAENSSSITKFSRLVVKEVKEMPKISVRRNCVLLGTSLYHQPYGKIRPDKRENHMSNQNILNRKTKKENAFSCQRLQRRCLS